MDGDIGPNSIEYWGPSGMVWLRNPQIRWTFLNNGPWTAAVALEHPSNDIDPGNIRLLDENIAANIQPEASAIQATPKRGLMSFQFVTRPTQLPARLFLPSEHAL